jgi:hypothetical protein
VIGELGLPAESTREAAMAAFAKAWRRGMRNTCGAGRPCGTYFCTHLL